MASYKRSRYIVEAKSRDENYTLLFNTRTCALLQVPTVLQPQLSQCFERLQDDNCLEQTRLFQFLLQGGFIIDSSFNELDDIRYTYFKKLKASKLYLSIMPTLMCNMACPYCFEHHQDISMDAKAANSIMKFVEEKLRTVNELSLDWYGGEPLLKLDFIINLQKRLRSLCNQVGAKSSFSMTTNGYLLTPEICDKLVSTEIRSFQVTIDGPKHIHDTRRFLKGGMPSFDRIISNLSYAIEKADVSIRVNIDRYNFTYIEEMLRNLSSLGLLKARSLSFKAIVPAGGQDDSGYAFSMSEFANVLQHCSERASAMGFKVWIGPIDTCKFCLVDTPEQWIIGPDLHVFKCADAFDAKDSVGYLTEDGSLHLNEFINIWRAKPIFNDPNCIECIYLPQCMGGCSLKKLIHRKDWCPEERFALESYVLNLYHNSIVNQDSSMDQLQRF